MRSDYRHGIFGDGGAAALLVLLFFPVIALLLRWRWRLAEARREEVQRLVTLAAEEAARAEHEALLAYSSTPADPVVAVAKEPAVMTPYCYVCQKPTNTRCSRCKAVRYCSGRCQILHWRQGHKDDCRPPQVNMHEKGPGGLSGANGVQGLQAEQTDTYCSTQYDGDVKSPGSGEVYEGTTSESNSSELFSEDDNHDKCSVSTSGTESTSDTTFSSPSSQSMVSSPQDSVDASFNGNPVLVHDSTGADLIKHPSSGLTSMKSSVNSVSCSVNSKQKVSSCDAEEVDSGLPGSHVVANVRLTNDQSSQDSTKTQGANSNKNELLNPGNDNYHNSVNCQLDHGNQLKSASLEDIRPDLAAQTVSGTMSGNDNFSEVALLKSVPSPGIRRQTASGSRIVNNASLRSNDVSFLNHEGSKSSLHAASTGRANSSNGEYVFLSSKSAVDSRSPLSTRLHESTHSTSTGINNLKTSMERVLHQYRSFKSPREYPSNVGCDIKGIYGYKRNFPYDLFVKLYNEKVELRPFGLINSGNSCYANAVLQCLAFTRPLTAYLLEGIHSKTCSKSKWCFVCEFESLLLNAKQGKSPISPIGILSHIDSIGSSLSHGREEDAHEFLRYAIDAMQSSCLKEAGPDVCGRSTDKTTLIQMTFGGFLRSKIKCLRCQGKSTRQEPMMDLTVEIDGNVANLEDALIRFTDTEILDGENKYQCSRCNSYEKAKKKLTILEAPNILTIALKRFQSGKFGKLNKAVRFPEYLNIAPYMSHSDDKSPVYSLYGAVVHLDIMNAAFSGHYVCYVKNMQGKWYKVDDSTVKPVELETVLSKGAYLLLYARCSPRSPNSMSKTSPRTGVKGNKDRDKTYVYKRSHSQDTANDNIPGYYGNKRFTEPKVDSSSDSSSLFSCSDEGSWSTESTRDSTSTEEYSDYIFGDSSSSWNSPLRISEDPDGYVFSPLSSMHSDSTSNLHSPNLYPDTSRKSRQFTERRSDRENDWSSNSIGVKSSATLRRFSNNRAAQTFYG